MRSWGRPSLVTSKDADNDEVLTSRTVDELGEETYKVLVRHYRWLDRYPRTMSLEWTKRVVDLETGVFLCLGGDDLNPVAHDGRKARQGRF